MINNLIKIKEMGIILSGARTNYKQERNNLKALQKADGDAEAIMEQKKKVLEAAKTEEEAIEALLEAVDVL